MRYQHLVARLLDTPWAITPQMLSVIVEVVGTRAAGIDLPEDEIKDRLALAAATNGPRRGGARSGKVAVLPLYGVITPRQNLMSETSGGTSLEAFATAFREVMADPEIGAVIFDVDSPGGAVEGVEEFAAEVRAARGAKPIVAVANQLMASAAYYIAAQADEIVASPSSQVGSIGVLAAHEDWSRAMDVQGVTTTLISAGKFKADGNRFEPLSDTARSDIQAKVDAYYQLFVSAVAKGRGVSVEAVRGPAFGEGRVLGPFAGAAAKQAIGARVIDRVDTLDNTIRRLARGGAVRPLAAPEPDGLLALGPGLALAERFDLVLVEAEALVAHSETRAALRAEQGRSLSADHRERLGRLAEVAGRLAADPEPEPQPDPEPEPVAGFLVGPMLDLIEAAARGGYRLSD